MEKLYTTQEVADLLKIKKSTVYELIKRGELSSSKIGKQLRISDSNLNAYAQTNKSLDKEIEIPKPNYSENNLLKNEYLKNSSGLIICGQDPILDILSTYIESHPQGLPTLRSYMGSYNSLYALYFDKIHIATTHLWNSKDNSYNTSYVSHLLPGVDTTIIRLFKRMQGFYVKKGNPKNIKSFQDLTRSDVTFINREKGSGTRVLLDEHLVIENISKNNIKGYDTELLSHITCAGNVAMNKADVALGHANAIDNFPTLDFIPLQEECYDLVIKKSSLSPQLYNTIIEIINSDNFKSQVSYLSGYDLSETGNIISLN